MKLKQRFTLSNIIILITSIASVGVISICFLIMFILKYPVEELYISRAELLNPAVLSRAIGDFFQSNPSALRYLIMWLVLIIGVLAVITTGVTGVLSRNIQSTVSGLTAAADNIRNGNLDCSVMESAYDEIDVLCRSFDSMRRSLKTAEATEKRMREERSMLLANLSHDLKTPVTSIKGYIEGIRDGIADTPEKQKKYLDTIYSKAVMIDDMVNNLSVFSKLELSKLKFEFTVREFNGFLREVFEEYCLDLEKNNMELRIETTGEPVNIKADWEKMRRVFAKIVSNSIKYKKDGRGVLEVKSHLGDSGVYVTVTDDGIGINENELASVFDEFYRVDAARTMNIKGSGLGLGIAKQIVENHGGKIWLKSDGEGKGTTAVIYLPEYKEENI